MDLKEYSKIMKDCGVCFGSLSFCCDKRCPNRDSALKKLGLSTKKFKYLKHYFDLVLILYLEELEVKKWGKQ